MHVTSRHKSDRQRFKSGKDAEPNRQRSLEASLFIGVVRVQGPKERKNAADGASRGEVRRRGDQPRRGDRVQPMAQAMGEFNETGNSAPKGA